MVVAKVSAYIHIRITTTLQHYFHTRAHLVIPMRACVVLYPVQPPYPQKLRAIGCPGSKTKRGLQMLKITTKLSERLGMKQLRQSHRNVTHTMDQILWDFARFYGEKLPRLTRRKLSQEEIATSALRAFEATGHAVRQADADGNLTWRATPELLEYAPSGSGGIVTIRAPSFDREERS